MSRLLQVFLSDNPHASGPFIFEVTAKDRANTELNCTCPSSMITSSCKHIRLVKERIAHNDGQYPYQFIKEVTPAQFKSAMRNEKSLRNLVVKNAKVEVL